MNNDLKELLKRLADRALIILSVLSILTSIYLLIHLEKKLAYGTVGAIVGIFLSAISARHVHKNRDRLIVGLSIATSFYFQYWALTS
ncbi:hypothetical protein PSCICM_24130 [Pseudomonas cichorii]|nr:hypothetical protein PSCICM_24130 [Pseudomonas cichorii]